MSGIPLEAPTASSSSPHLPRLWLWFVVLGVVQLILGVIALGSPLVIGLATAVLIGWVLMIGGVLEIVHGFADRQWRGFFLDLLGGILYLVIGFMVVANPGLTLLTVTMLVAMFLFTSGIFRIVMALAERFPHWGWMLLNGIISLLLGISIWRQWPVSGLWVVGLFVGIEMLLHGWSLVMLGLAGKRLRAVITSKLERIDVQRA
jgi:uncharacterized membrane protein HdeD (DUF308 family)